MDSNKLLMAILTALVIGITGYIGTLVFSLNERVIALEKDKEYLLPQVNGRIERLERKVLRIE